MRKNRIISVLVSLALIVSVLALKIPAAANAETFYYQFISECEGEEWFISYVNSQFIKNGRRLTSISNENDDVLLSIKELIYPNADIDKLPVAIKYLKNVETVDLASNSLTDVSRLTSLNKIKSLNLSANEIRNINLSQLTMLETCDISDNELVTMPDFSQNTSLTSLSLRNNGISDVTGLTGLHELEYVCLSNNEISDCSSLASLYMANGELDLSYNMIDDMSWISGTNGISVLNVSYNFVASGLDDVPRSIKTLNVAANGVVDFSALSELTWIENLNVSRNKIAETDFLEKLTSLKTLDLSYNLISYAPKLTFLSQMLILDVSHNRLYDLPVASGMTSLLSLDVSYNTISSAAMANKYPSLQYIDVSHNRIEDFGFISGMTNLSYADFSYNLLTTAEPDLYLTTPKLKTLKLSGNNFSAAEICDILANGYRSVYLCDINLSGKIPDMTRYPNVAELYVSGSTLSATDINHILTRTDYTGLGLGGFANNTLLARLSNMTNLTTLDLSGTNNVSSLADAVEALNVVNLILSDCGLSELDSEFFTESVRKIDASGNNISEISDQTAVLAARNGTKVDFRSNPVETVGKAVIYLESMFDIEIEYGKKLTLAIDEMIANVGMSMELYSMLEMKNIYTGNVYQLPSISEIEISTTNSNLVSVDGNTLSFTVNETIYDYDKQRITLSFGMQSVSLTLYNAFTPYASEVINGTKVLYGFEVGSTVGDMLDNMDFPQSYTVEVKKADGTLCSRSALIATGETIKVTSGNTVLFEASFILFGDGNGDGRINSTDYMLIKRHFFGQSELEGLYFEAADVSHDGRINSTDFMLIKRHFFGQSLINQTK